MLVFSELPEAEAINMMKLSLLTRTIGTLLRLMLNVMGILSLHGVQILPQNRLPAHGVHQGDLHAGELDVSGHEVHTLRVVQDTLAGAQRFVHQNTAHRVREGEGQLVRLGVAQADGQAGLGVSIHQQHLLSGLGQPDV